MLTYYQDNPPLKNKIKKQDHEIRFVKSSKFNQVKIKYDPEEKILYFEYLDRFSPKLKLRNSTSISINIGNLSDLFDFVIHQNNSKYTSCLKTYATQINNKIKDCYYGYRITMGVYYKHFPFKIQNKGNHLQILNYLGYKSPILIPYSNLQVNIIDNKNLELIGYDRISLGNFAHILTRIKDKTKLRNLDPRKFIDSIYIKQKELL
jgi:ribosomal protein L6P/L9E